LDGSNHISVKKGKKEEEKNENMITYKMSTQLDHIYFLPIEKKSNRWYVVTYFECNVHVRGSNVNMIS